MTHGSVNQQVQAPELVPVIFGRGRGWGLGLVGMDAVDHGTGLAVDRRGLGHVQGTLEGLRLERTEVGGVGKGDLVVGGGWGGEGETRAVLATAVVFLAAAAGADGDQGGGRVERWVAVEKRMKHFC